MYTKHWKRSFFTIAVGQMFSLISSSAVQFALIWWIATETGSALMMGISGLAAFLPSAVFSPVAGILADRHHRKYICIIADLSIGLIAAVFAVLLWVFEMPVWTAMLILFFRGIGGTFHQPALQAMIPQFVPEEELVRVGGWDQMLMSGSFLLGPALGAALYAMFPLPVILLVDLIGAVIASAMMAVVTIPKLEIQHKEKRHVFEEIKEGIDVFRNNKALGIMIVIETLCMIFYAPLSSFYPLMTSDYFQGTAWHASAVEVAFALGMMISAILFGSVLKVRRHMFVAYLGLLGTGITSAFCGLLPPTMSAWCIFAITCCLMGACGNIHGIPLIAYMQATIDPAKMGRAFSLCALLGSLAMPVGLIFSAPIAEWVGVHAWFLTSGISMILFTVIGMAIHKKKLKHI